VPIENQLHVFAGERQNASVNRQASACERRYLRRLIGLDLKSVALKVHRDLIGAVAIISR
jgi:hypothetical protein